MADARDSIPPIPTITLDQCEQLITESPNIYTAMLGVDPKPLPSDEHVGRLAPKRVELWRNAAHEVERVWDQINKLFDSSSSIPRPPECEPLPIIDREATTRQWLDRNYCQPALSLLKSIASRVRQGQTDGTDPWFVETLSSVGHIWFEHEKHRSPRQSIDVDTAKLAEDIRHNAAFHYANARHASPELEPEPTTVGDQQLIEKAQKRYKDPRVDIEYIYDTPQRHHSQEGGLACLVIECKSAHKLTVDLLEDVLHRFDRFCNSSSLRERWMRDGSIPLRSALYADDADALDPQAIAVLGCLVQLYHAMLRRRQTFGVLTSVDATLLLNIDWSHATEAGQRVLVATLAQPNAILKPCSSPELRRWTPFHVIVALAILQLEQGLRPEKDIDDLCKLLWSRQTEYQLPLDRNSDDSEDAVDPAGSDPDGSGGRPRKARRMQDGQRRSAAWVPLVIDAASISICPAQQQHQQQQQQQQKKVSKQDNDVAKLLASAGKSRPELEKLVALEAHGGCLSVDPHELGRLLCAIFPLVPSTENQRKRQFASTNRINHPRYIHSSLELLRPRTLEWGPVPSWLNRRLAITDDPELAWLMANENRLLVKRRGANLGRSGGDNGDDDSNDDGSSNSSSNDKSSSLQHNANDDSETDSSSSSLGSAKEPEGLSS